LKLFIKIIVVLISLIILSGLLLQIDDELEPEVIDFMALSEPPSDSSHAYFYLLGFSSAEGKEPITAGRDIYQEIEKQQLIISAERDENDYFDSSQYDELVLPNHSLLCNYKESNCLDNIFNNTEQLPDLLNSASLLMQRYEEYSTFSDFHTLTKPDISEPLPPYQYLTMAVRLTHLQKVLIASQGKPNNALQQLYKLHHQLRSQLEQQDTLIGKLILLGLLSENIDLISVLATRYQLKLTQEIDSLSEQERSLAVGFSREVRMMHTLYLELDGAPDILNKEGDDSYFKIPSWLTYILFKVNMTTNESYKPLRYYSNLSEMPSDEFIHEMQQDEVQISNNLHWLRNAIGTVLSQVATPNYNAYISDFWDVENKILLLNARLSNTSIEEIINEVSGVYSQPPYLSEDKRQLCFENPYNVDTKYNCLRLSY
jgi:hypothetical protein